MAASLTSRDGVTTLTSSLQSTSSSRLAEGIASDYAAYLSTNAQKERKALVDSGEDLLVRLGEFCEDVDTIRQDIGLSVSKTTPEIQAKASDLQVIFDRIDKLEKFIGVVKANLDDLEREVRAAESNLPSSGPVPLIKSVLGIFGKISGTSKGQGKLRGPQVTAASPFPVFKTSEYIVHDLANTDGAGCVSSSGADDIAAS